MPALAWSRAVTAFAPRGHPACHAGGVARGVPASVISEGTDSKGPHAPQGMAVRVLEVLHRLHR